MVAVGLCTIQLPTGALCPGSQVPPHLNSYWKTVTFSVFQIRILE